MALRLVTTLTIILNYTVVNKRQKRETVANKIAYIICKVKYTSIDNFGHPIS